MTETSSSSHWKSRLKALGPGILMASAAVGGSHIVSSTQAGALYGWQLAIIILLVNLFKYPFFRFGSQYTLASRKSLLEGYAEKGKAYLFVFFILNIFSAFVNTAAVGVLAATLLNFMLPPIGLSVLQLSVILIVVTWGILLIGGYRFLDGLSKLVMTALTIATVLAVIMAIVRGHVVSPDFVAPTPWKLAALPFIVSLMGWMPAPIEISAINSMWVVAKRKINKIDYKDGLFDFNVGYIGTAILAFIFLALGALIQYGSSTPLNTSSSSAYISQFMKMYGTAIGQWSQLLIAFIAFMCIFGTTITVIDGYSRANAESLRLLLNKDQTSKLALNIWMTVTAAFGIIIPLYFMSNVAALLKFSMICSFISTPIFAWLNLLLVRKGEHKVTGPLYWLSILGLLYLAGFALFFLAYLIGLIH